MNQIPVLTAEGLRKLARGELDLEALTGRAVQGERIPVYAQGKRKAEHGGEES